MQYIAAKQLRLPKQTIQPKPQRSEKKRNSMTPVPSPFLLILLAPSHYYDMLTSMQKG